MIAYTTRKTGINLFLKTEAEGASGILVASFANQDENIQDQILESVSRINADRAAAGKELLGNSETFWSGRKRVSGKAF